METKDGEGLFSGNEDTDLDAHWLGNCCLLRSLWSFMDARGRDQNAYRCFCSCSGRSFCSRSNIDTISIALWRTGKRMPLMDWFHERQVRALGKGCARAMLIATLAMK